jgi:hypothetical protein
MHRLIASHRIAMARPKEPTRFGKVFKSQLPCAMFIAASKLVISLSPKWSRVAIGATPSGSAIAQRRGPMHCINGNLRASESRLGSRAELLAQLDIVVSIPRLHIQLYVGFERCRKVALVLALLSSRHLDGEVACVVLFCVSCFCPPDVACNASLRLEVALCQLFVRIVHGSPRHKNSVACRFWHICDLWTALRR